MRQMAKAATNLVVEEMVKKERNTLHVVQLPALVRSRKALRANRGAKKDQRKNENYKIKIKNNY